MDPRAFRALLRAAVRMDVRSQRYGRATRAGTGVAFTPLFFVIAQNLVISLAVSAVLVRHADVLGYATINLSVSMFLLASAVVVEFNEVVLSPEDAHVLAHLPISPRTYAAVRLANLCLYVMLLGASLNLCPVVVGAWLRDASLLFVPTYLIVATAANVMVTGAVIAVYLALGQVLGDRRLKESLAYAQIGLTLLAVYGIQLFVRDRDNSMLQALQHVPDWLAWTPPGWFAGVVEALARQPLPRHAWQVAAAVGSLVALSWYAFAQLSRQYSRVHRGQPMLHGADRARVRRRADGFAGRALDAITGPRAEAAAFRLCWTMFRRDHDLKMRSYPSLGAAVGFFLIGWLSNQLADPLARDATGGDTAPSIVILYFLVMAVPIVSYNMAFSRDYQAAWLFDTSPIERQAVTSGLCKLIVVAMVLPVLLLLFVGFSLVWWNAWHAIIHCGVGFLLCFITVQLTRIGLLRDWPFSRRYVRGEVSGRVSLFVAAVMGGATLVGLCQTAAYRSTPQLVAFVGALVVACGVLYNRFACSRA